MIASILELGNLVEYTIPSFPVLTVTLREAKLHTVSSTILFVRVTFLQASPYLSLHGYHGALKDLAWSK